MGIFHDVNFTRHYAPYVQQACLKVMDFIELFKFCLKKIHRHLKVTETRWHFSVSWKIVHEKNNWFLATFVVYNSRYLFFFKFYLFFLDKNYNPQLVHWGKGKSTPSILLLVSWKSANILPSISSIKYSLIHWNQSQGVYLSNHSNYFLMK